MSRQKPLRRWTVIKQGKGPFRRYWVKVTPSGSYGRAEEPPPVGMTLMPTEHPKKR